MSPPLRHIPIDPVVVERITAWCEANAISVTAISPLLLYLTSLVIRIYSAITQPRVARCPDGFALLLGVPPHGETECVSTWDPRPDDTKGRCEHEHWDAGRLPMRVWCEPDELAVVIDDRTVDCRARPPPS